MNKLIGLLLLIVRIYCGVLVLWWMVRQNFNSAPSINEIYTPLVFMILDIWIQTTGQVVSEED